MFPSPLTPNPGPAAVARAAYRPLRPFVGPALATAVALSSLPFVQAGLLWWWASDASATSYGDLPGAKAFSVAIIGLSVVAWIANCSWLWRARANTLALSEGRAVHVRAAGWVWTGWWVPLASFWVPFQVVADVREESTGREEEGHLRWWWAGWLTAGFLGLWDGFVAVPDNAHDDLVRSAALFSAAAVVMAATAVLWVRLVLDVTRAQEATAHEQARP